MAQNRARRLVTVGHLEFAMVETWGVIELVQ